MTPVPGHSLSSGRLQQRRRARPLLAALGLLLALCLTTAKVLGQAASPEMLSINMRDAEIGAVIQWIAEKTNKQIVIDPRVKGKITVLANQQMTIEQAYQVFLAALDVFGYSASEQDGILRIYPSALAKSTPSTIVQDYQNLSGGEQIVYVYRAQNVSATRLQALVTPLVAPGGYISAFEDSNSLVLGDDASNVKRLVNLLSQVDRSGDFDIVIVRLQHASAEKVAGLVSSLVNNDAENAFAIASDQRSNSVLLSGDPATRQRVTKLIRELDQPLSANGVTRVVYLNYLDAEEVQPILKNLSQTVSEDSKDADSAAASVSVEASKSANAIIMTAPPGMLELMENVIRDIDVRRSQVLVEAIIVEVSKEFIKQIGVQWNTSLEGYDNVEAATNFGLAPDASAIANATSLASVLPGGLSLGYYRNGSLRALIQAIANESDANILSTPSIVTLDNQEAEILVGSNVPFRTGQYTTSGSTSADPFTTIERQDIGVTLKITPQVNKDASVTLDILQEVERLAPPIDEASDIVTNKRSIKTKVLVEDGTILVLGGLISDEERVIESKVPFLGDLPLLGNLFKSTENRLEKRNLMVFIHPVIIDSQSVSERVTREKYDRARVLQQRYQEGNLSIEDATLKDFDTYKPTKPVSPATDNQL